MGRKSLFIRQINTNEKVALSKFPIFKPNNFLINNTSKIRTSGLMVFSTNHKKSFSGNYFDWRDILAKNYEESFDNYEENYKEKPDVPDISTNILKGSRKTPEKSAKECKNLLKSGVVDSLEGVFIIIMAPFVVIFYIAVLTIIIYLAMKVFGYPIAIIMAMVLVIVVCIIDLIEFLLGKR